MPPKTTTHRYARYRYKCSAILTVIAGLSLLASPSDAASLPAAEDANATGTQLTKPGNKAGSLTVDGNRQAFVYFNPVDLGSNTTASVSSVRLRIYLTSVTAPGALTLHEVTGAWSELDNAKRARPEFKQTPFATIPSESVISKQFVTLDVTDLVKGWIENPESNKGLAIVSNGTARVQIGAKEGSGTGYPAELDVDLAPADGSITSAKLSPDFRVPSSAIVGTLPSSLIANGTITGAQLEDSPSITGTVSADNFIGSGVGLTQLNAEAIRGAQFLEWVEVGHPGNAADPLTGYGAVGKPFKISKHEVTNGQYVAFLNAVAAADPNGLYNPLMGIDPVGGIARCGVSPGSYSYIVRKAMRDKPVIFVSWFDVIRFCNWIHNGRPSGAQDAETTEAGAYVIAGTTASPRSPAAKCWLPDENEWYKAAYYDPSRNNGAGGYWKYPTASNTAPSVAGSDGQGNVFHAGLNIANHAYFADWNGLDGNVTTVGSGGSGSESAFEVADLAGNVWEWVETEVGAGRGLRGGCWYSEWSEFSSTYRHRGIPVSEESKGVGFRVASP